MNVHTRRRSLPEFLADLRWGVKWGSLLSGAYASYAVLYYCLVGAAVFIRFGLGLWHLVIFYLLAPTLAGAIVGVLRPLTGSLWGSAVVGILAGTPVSFLGNALILPREQWADRLVPLSLFATVLLGGLLGLTGYVTREGQANGGDEP